MVFQARSSSWRTCLGGELLDGIKARRILAYAKTQLSVLAGSSQQHRRFQNPARAVSASLGWLPRDFLEANLQRVRTDGTLAVHGGASREACKKRNPGIRFR